MLKKIAAAAGAGAIFLSLVTPALATGNHWWWHNEDELLIQNTNTSVQNNVTTKADTGDNSIHGKWVLGGKINTGDAWAGAEVGNTVNLSVVEGCGCFDDVTIRNQNTGVENNVYTKADTGDNSIHGKLVGSFHGEGYVGPRIRTGDAGASSLVVNDVNTSIVGGGLE